MLDFVYFPSTDTRVRHILPIIQLKFNILHSFGIYFKNAKRLPLTESIIKKV